MDEKVMGGCTGNCHTCGSQTTECNGEPKESFFDKLEKYSEAFDAVGDDEIIRMLDEVVAELEKEN